MIDALTLNVPENRHSDMIDRFNRIQTMRRAAEIMGRKPLADAMGVAERTLRSYTGVERGISDEMMCAAAAALDAYCAEIAAHAAKMRELTGGRDAG